MLFFFRLYNSFVSAVAGGNLLFFDLDGFFLTVLHILAYGQEGLVSEGGSLVHLTIRIASRCLGS